ncbi:MAG: TonB-dependent receptor [bacterium]|nr:TonB-dependent receptor [bacterium]
MKRTTLLTFALALALVVSLTLTPTATAQETTATIRGTVVDADDEPIAEARIQVLDTRTGNIKSLTSNADGLFLATRLSPGGPYIVIVNDLETVEVPNLAVAEIYNLRIKVDPEVITEMVTVTASRDFVEVATGPAATFDSFKLETTVAFNRDIQDAYGIDPRVNIDNGERGFEVNCAGKHPRFNSVTLDGVGQNDRFGLNTNGYSTATGMPFPYDAIAQLAVELAPADVTYGGFSACTINAVTKSGTNEFKGNLFYEYTDESLKGDSLGGESGDFSSPPFESTKTGFTLGGRLMADKLHFFAAYETTESPRFLAHGYAGSGNGVERDWLSQADYDRIVSIANSLYGYDPGGLPGDGSQEEDKQMLKLDWNAADRHNLSLIYNFYDGFQARGSDSDNNEFEFPNHFYTKGAESTTTTARLSSQWGDALSTELFLSNNTMDDSQVTVGPPDFGDFQISIGGRTGTVYLGADDSRQANSLATDTDYAKLSAQLLRGRNVFTAGYEIEKNDIFNIFVQHSRGGEWDFFDSSVGNPAFCADLTAQGRFDDPACGVSGIDRFELGRPSRVYYGSGGGTNVANDAAASFGNTLNSIYLQDEIFFDERNLTVAAGLRYEFFTSSDNPTFNQAFTDANGGLRNDSNLDGLSLLMPRLGVIWGPKPQMSVRASLGRFSGGNPNVWVSNAWSNDGVTNVQTRLDNFDRGSVFDGTIPLTGPNPGRDVPQTLFDQVAGTTAADAARSRLVLIDPNYEQPFEDKFSLGLTYRFNSGYQADFDYLHTELEDSAIYVDLSQTIVGTTLAGAPIYDFTNGSDNLMLTNSGFGASADILSLLVTKRWDNGLDVSLGYANIDGKDVSPMTSFVALSNFENLATSDINNPRPAKSNYVVPHRFTVRASLGREFFGSYETRFTLFGYLQEGQPQSFAMNGGDLEGDGFFGRHLLYVPTGTDDPNVVFADSFQTQEFFDWVQRQGFGPGFLPRNGTHTRWSNRVDIGVHQDFALGFARVNGRAFVKIYNFGNFLNDDWGKVYDAFFFTPEVVDTDVNAAGQYVFTDFNESNATIDNLLEFRSLWEMRWGVEIRF